MDQQLFMRLINLLTPQTLAYLVRDLTDRQEDWQFYPEDATPEAIQQELKQILETIIALGTERASAEGLDFALFVQQASAAQQQEDWPWQRDRQEQQNWTEDLA
jgi:hypothetical protein